jgi:nucleotide-binding universal stress UspA family protein
VGGPVDASLGAMVVGVDGSPDAATALIWALRQAQVAGLAVSVVHAWSPDEEFGLSPYGNRITRDRALTVQAARDRVHQAVALASSRVPIGRCLINQLAFEGEPGAVLVELSRDAAQLVVGATGTGALPGFLTPALGSTTRFVLRHAWCPVTVVPSARLRAEAVTGAARLADAAVPPARSPRAGS